MEFTIINPAENTLMMGSRLISSMLKSFGHKVNMIFITEDINNDILSNIYDICKKSDYICLSFMTMNYYASCEITKALKIRFPHIKIIWGGIHATLCPEDCDLADLICVGDGELFFKNLINNNIPDDEKIIFSDMITNLNEYPTADFDLNNKWVTINGTITKIDYKIQKQQFESDYLRLKDGSKSYCYTTQSSRGCPHRCTYCSNAGFLDLFKNKKTLRRRSVKHLIDELKMIVKRYPYINSFSFYDDSFFSTSDDEIELFAKAYIESDLNRPFYALASPLTLTERKLSALVRAGLGHLQMGIQTGSERVNKEIYKRFASNKITLEKCNILNKYKDKIIPHYDMIVDNPYETNDDKFESVKFLYNLPKPYRVQLHSLVFYPHTEMYDMAKKDGLLKDKDIGYNKTQSKFADTSSIDFYSFIVVFSPYIPKYILKLLTYRLIFNIANMNIFKFIYPLLTNLALWYNNRFKIDKNVVEQ